MNPFDEPTTIGGVEAQERWDVPNRHPGTDLRPATGILVAIGVLLVVIGVGVLLWAVIH